jgi:hypothetical protein
MPRIVRAVLLLSLLLAGSGTPVALGQGERFVKYVNKYPNDLLKAEPEVKQRLHALLGREYGRFVERLQTQTPMENIKGILTGRGCKAHLCGSEEAVLLINLSDGKLHVAIHSEASGERVQKFSEDMAHFPDAALQYALEN